MKQNTDTDSGLLQTRLHIYLHFGKKANEAETRLKLSQCLVSAHSACADVGNKTMP